MRSRPLQPAPAPPSRAHSPVHGQQQEPEEVEQRLHEGRPALDGRVLLRVRGEHHRRAALVFQTQEPGRETPLGGGRAPAVSGRHACEPAASAPRTRAHTHHGRRTRSCRGPGARPRTRGPGSAARRAPRPPGAVGLGGGRVRGPLGAGRPPITQPAWASAGQGLVPARGRPHCWTWLTRGPRSGYAKAQRDPRQRR